MAYPHGAALRQLGVSDQLLAAVASTTLAGRMVETGGGIIPHQWDRRTYICNVDSLGLAPETSKRQLAWARRPIATSLTCNNGQRVPGQVYHPFPILLPQKNFSALVDISSVQRKLDSLASN